jgi:hypothetical protein
MGGLSAEPPPQKSRRGVVPDVAIPPNRRAGAGGEATELKTAKRSHSSRAAGLDESTEDLNSRTRLSTAGGGEDPTLKAAVEVLAQAIRRSESAGEGNKDKVPATDGRTSR